MRIPSPSLSTATSPQPFFQSLVTRIIPPQTRCRRHLEHNFRAVTSLRHVNGLVAQPTSRAAGTSLYISVAPFRISCVLCSLVFTIRSILCAYIWFSAPVVSLYWRTQPSISTYEITKVLILHNFLRPSRFSHSMWPSPSIIHLIQPAVDAFEATSRLPVNACAVSHVLRVVRAPPQKPPRAAKQRLKASANTPGQPITS